MEFGIPPRANETSNFPLKMPPRLRADRGLDYLGFIKLLKGLWKEVHPDIPIRPSQSSQYAKYPVIIYGLEMRKTHVTEPKKRFREIEYRQDEDTHLQIAAQRFDNVISFTVITENNPDHCEIIIETFEDFMMEMTPVFKQMGVSEFLYIRRLPDREQTRPDEDVEERAVSYMVVLEKILITEVDKLDRILVKARTEMTYYYSGSDFWHADPDDENALPQFLVCPNNPFEVGDLVQLHIPGYTQDPTNGGAYSFVVPVALPDGLHDGFTYQISIVDGPNIYLQHLDGRTVDIRSIGMGTISGAPDLSAFVDAEIVDNFQSTPLY